MGQRGQKVTRPPLVWGQQQCPHLSPGPFWAPPVSLSHLGGVAVPHWGAAMPLTPPLQVSPQGWWPWRWQCPLEEERGPMEGGGLLSPKAGGRGGATVASVSPPLHVPPLNPPFWVTSGRGRRSVTPRGGGEGVMVRGWGAHPKIEPSSHPKGTPPPHPLHRGVTIWGWET